MATKFFGLFALLILATLNGCTYGLLYTDSTKPYVLDMQETPVGVSKPNQDQGAKFVSVPTTMISAGWSSRAIGEAAKQAGLNEIYYADIHTFSVLLGLWEEKTLIVYGK